MAKKNIIDRLDKRISIQEKSITEDGVGGFTEEWNVIRNIWAEIKPNKAFDKFEAEQTGEKITHIITVRYFPELKTEHRIGFQDRVFNIKGIINSFEENRILEIRAEEIL